MLTQELRIGNYVYGVSDRIEQVIQLSETKVTTDIIKINAPMEIGLDDISPIPLTEEWLLKFGFKVKDRKSHLNTYIFYIPTFEIDYCLFYADFRLDYGLYVEYTDSPFSEDDEKLYPITFGIKYVHQLQNLLYSLTGEELTIKQE
jgi:hypothetical protein